MLGDAQEKKQINDHLGLLDSEALGEYHEVTLTNAKKLPFNSTAQSPVSVALTQVRKNLFYTVETTVLEHTGMVGEVEIQDKARNGFKLRFTGSGSSVKVGVRVKGGMA
ncbi:MAG: hypothetical protein IJT94_08280 [Oscillibacter sp.]|nr:hypothetical protein [Oscillibacter sp.]